MNASTAISESGDPPPPVIILTEPSAGRVTVTALFASPVIVKLAFHASSTVPASMVSAVAPTSASLKIRSETGVTASAVITFIFALAVPCTPACA
ncbi:hypothetical protein D3C72_1591860 [compost metagenome]